MEARAVMAGAMEEVVRGAVRAEAARAAAMEAAARAAATEVAARVEATGEVVPVVARAAEVRGEVPVRAAVVKEEGWEGAGSIDLGSPYSRCRARSG